MVVGMGLNIQPLCALKQCTLRAQIDGIALSNTRNSRTNDRTLCLLLQCGLGKQRIPKQLRRQLLRQRIPKLSRQQLLWQLSQRLLGQLRCQLGKQASQRKRLGQQLCRQLDQRCPR